MGCEASSQNQIQPVNLKSGRTRRKLNSLKKDQAANLTQSEHYNIVSETLKQQQMKMATKILKHHQIFGPLTSKELKSICEKMMCVSIKEGQYVFKQGDIGSSFFIIEKGQVTVHIDGKIVRTLTQGQTFGQLALLLKSSRTASILCSKECQFFLMKSDIYKETLRKMKLEQHSTNVQTINKVPLFACLTNKQRFQLSDTIKIFIFEKDEKIFSAGDDSQAIYIISEGSVKIQMEGKKDIILNPGQIFGESSLQKNTKRLGTAVANTKVVCSLISRHDIQTTLGSCINNLIFFNTKKWALMRSETFKNLEITDLLSFLTQFKIIQVKNNQTIDKQTYKGFIICLEGSINNNKDSILLNQEGWKSKSYACQNLKKNGDGLCCFLPFKKAEKIFAQINNKKKLVSYQQKKTEKKVKLNFSDFSVIKKLGEGQFGEVFLVKNIQFGTNLYAVKCLKKQQLRCQEIGQTVVLQRKILQKSIFPYIVGYVKAFQDKNYIFLLMEYIHGKEMFDVIREVKQMSLDMIRYYFACIMVSIEYLHGKNIIYRDIKPENSVVDYKGKVYLIDLGTARQLTENQYFKTFTIIGTPSYMAPEIFQGQGYSFEVDLWSLGCLLYQFYCFGLPFKGEEADDPYETYKSIIKEPLTFPNFMKNQKAKSLITLLLAKDPKKRGLFDFNMIKSHEYFKGFDWTALLDEQMKSPYIPKDFRNFKGLDFNSSQGKQLQKYIYKSEKDFQIEQWTSDQI